MSEAVAIAQVTKSVHVACGIEHAFRVFSSEIGTWWPLDTHALHQGEVREVVWEEREGGEVYEISNGGKKGHWASVLAWEPPVRVVIAWQVNPEDPAPTELEVRFTPENDGTRVHLEHRHWERLGDRGAEARDQYDEGWGTVLGKYAAHLA